jgi:hypothetical protein
VPLYKNRAPIHVIAPVPPHMQAAARVRMARRRPTGDNVADLSASLRDLTPGNHISSPERFFR